MRLNLAEGTITEILAQDRDMTVVSVNCQGREYKGISYHGFSAVPVPGDQVILNTTALDLGLGTGGYHFIVSNISRPLKNRENCSGHIMKLRYTPFQFSVLSVEEEDSPYRKLLENHSSLAGTPVVAGLLHSHLVPAVLALNWAGKGKLKIAYVMTDGGALPISFSQQVKLLKEKNLLVGTVTVGQAFGGDLEAVNCYSGLLAAKSVLEADVIIVSMGPGIAGTNTKFGFSGVEQGQVVNAVAALEGRPVVIPRISFADPRPRHHGLSHHSRTILKTVIMSRGWVGLPALSNRENLLLNRQIREERLDEKHTFIVKETAPLEDALLKYGLKVHTMGRSFSQDPAFFGAAWASGLVAYDLMVSDSEK